VGRGARDGGNPSTEEERLNEAVDGVNTQVRYCGAPTREGGTCRQILGIGTSGLCPFHDPARAEEVTEMRRRGARAGNALRAAEMVDSPPPEDPQTLEDVTRWHSWITGALARGQIDKATATGLAYNLQQHRAALQIRDLEREVLRLRETLAALKKGQQPGGIS
jgi:hypothetical protein